MHLVVGLGNPGRQYENTRHNVGFKAVTKLAKRLKAELSFKSNLDSLSCRTDVSGSDVVLLLPQTYMNNSGQAVVLAMKKYNIKPENIIVVHDEIDLLPGTIKIKNGGGSAGHNGIRSIISSVGSGGFIRIRIGVGKPECDGQTGAEYVLSDISGKDKKEIGRCIDNACDAIESIITEGIVSATNVFNKRDA